MSTVQPKGENLKKAIQWVSEKRKENPGINLARLAGDAGTRFDLSPMDSEFLLRFVKDDNHKDTA